MTSPPNHLARFPQGEFSLDRHPPDKRDQLRAWDAADEFVLTTLHERAHNSSGPPHVVVVNDRCGAIAVALVSSMPYAPISWVSDSVVARIALRNNLVANELDASKVMLLAEPDELDRPADIVIVKIPRSKDLLTAQLRAISQWTKPETLVIGAAMSRHIHSSTIECFETLVGPTTTSLAKKKARLIFSTAANAPTAAADFAGDAMTEYDAPVDDAHTLRVAAAPGVFSAGRFDPGTRLFTASLPRDLGRANVIDLGCGDGVVGTALATRMTGGDLDFADESFAAIRSARRTVELNSPLISPDIVVAFHAADVLRTYSPDPLEPPVPIAAAGTVDLIACNPPFHSDHAVTDATAWEMFSQSHEALVPGGELWVVGNRHLHYHAKLKRRFGNCDVAASTTKFVVLRSTR